MTYDTSTSSVKLNLLANSQSQSFTSPHLSEGSIMRFEPMYWTANGGRSTAYVVRMLNDNTGLQFKSMFTRHGDLTGLLWFSDDVFSHSALRYESNHDYTGCKISFGLELDENVPDLDDESGGMILTINVTDDPLGPRYYVRLFEYATRLAANSWSIYLDFDNLYGSYADGDVEEEFVKIKASKIYSLFFSLVPTGFVKESLEPLPKTQYSWVKLLNIYCTQSLSIGTVTAPSTPLRVCTSYDDSSNLNPFRIVKECVDVGFGGIINHYVGMSNYPHREFIPDAGKFEVRQHNGMWLNECAFDWHTEFVEACRYYGLSTMMSLSYELFSEFCPTHWAQRDIDGNLGVTGYSPPSHLISPFTEGFSFLEEVFVEFADIQANASQPVILQVGEPWWWWNVATRKPCVYDYPTLLAFHEKTGLYAPDFGTIDSTHTGTPYDEFKTFLQDALGDSVLALRDAVKTKYPNALCTALFFLPSILDESVGIMNVINYPSSQYSSPNLDFFVTEAYDWVVTGQLEKAKRAFTLPVEELGYHISQVHYLAGFVPDRDLAQAIGMNVQDGYEKQMWRRVMGSVRMAEQMGVSNVYIWAHPQVARDGIVFTKDYINFLFDGKEKTKATLNDGPVEFVGYG